MPFCWFCHEAAQITVTTAMPPRVCKMWFLRNLWIIFWYTSPISHMTPWENTWSILEEKVNIVNDSQNDRRAHYRAWNIHDSLIINLSHVMRKPVFDEVGPGKIQTSLLTFRCYLESWIFGYSKYRHYSMSAANNQADLHLSCSHVA